MVAPNNQTERYKIPRSRSAVVVRIISLTSICAAFFISSAQVQCVTYDNDTQLEFYWGAANGSVHHYKVFLYSVTDGVIYPQVGENEKHPPKWATSIVPTSENLFKVPMPAEHGKTYQLQVQAVAFDGTTGPMSDLSDSVKVDMTAPSTPVVTVDGDYIASAAQLHTSWTSNDAESGIVEYQYAVGTTPGGTDMVGWTSTGTEMEATVTGLSPMDGQTYYIDVKAKNGAGTWSDIAVSDGIIVARQNLHKGWNLISIYLDIMDTGLSSVLASIEGEGKCSSVWTYDAEPSSKGWKRYVVGGTDSPNNLKTMEHGKGYWINMTGDATLTIVGKPITEADIPLYSGWNLVGYSSSIAQLPEDALSSIPGGHVSIWTYDGITGDWPKYTINAPDFLNTLTQLVPGSGYWIYVQ